ncbi:MAG: FISUMP domain-containing protein [Bacteroidales bacterium]|nr:FISUMP domain-containing protein [Bacteroidales bacterium]
MKRFLLLLAILLINYSLNAQDYQLGFVAEGDATSIDSVLVENLAQNTSVVINGTDILHLVGTLDVRNNEKNSLNLSIFPNPFTEFSKIHFYTSNAGKNYVSIIDISGKKVIETVFNSEIGMNRLKVSGLSSGLYAITISNDQEQSTMMLSCVESSNSNPKISIENDMGEKEMNTLICKKRPESTIQMQYNHGDVLKVTAFANSHIAVKTIVPEASQVVNNEFHACVDRDGNNYAVVVIGAQVWMAENLRTTHFNNGNAIANITDNGIWTNLTGPAYCWYNNDENTYKKAYGALYNWYVVEQGNVCPVGWTVPADTLWTVLENYLMYNGFSYDGQITSNKVAKSLASTKNWNYYNGTGAVGNTDYPNWRNKTGFSAQPAGSRSYNSGVFSNSGASANWWTSTEYLTSGGRYVNLNRMNAHIYRHYYDKTGGYSIRCVKLN